MGRLRSPSSAASRSMSTKFDRAVSVKFGARTKPTRSLARAGTALDPITTLACFGILLTRSPKSSACLRLRRNPLSDSYYQNVDYVRDFPVLAPHSAGHCQG